MNDNKRKSIKETKEQIKNFLATAEVLNFIGKRGMGQLSMMELAIIISFGSAVGDPMVGTNLPIFRGMTVIMVFLKEILSHPARYAAITDG